MAKQIAIKIPIITEPPYKGIDLGDVFRAKAEGFRYELKYAFTPAMNEIIDDINDISLEISQNSQNTEAYRDSALLYRDQSLENKNISLTYKTAAELAYNNTKNIIDNLVIPIDATYTKDYIDNIKRRQFLNFRIGE